MQQSPTDIVNVGDFDASLSIHLSVKDALGRDVFDFGKINLGKIVSKDNLRRHWPWNTNTYAPGVYTLVGEVFDASGTMITTNNYTFNIAAGTEANTQQAVISIRSDKPKYQPNDRVRIDNLVRNITGNASIDNARVRVVVRNPADQIIFDHTHQLGQVGAGAIRAMDALFSLKSAMPGTYTIDAQLISDGNATKKAVAGFSTKASASAIMLAQATASYTVVALNGAPPAPLLGAPGNPASIPTLNGWGLMLLGLMMLVAGMVLMPRYARHPS